MTINTSVIAGCWGRVVAKKGELAVINCDRCLHAHLYPVPSMSEYYDKDQFYKNHSPEDWLYKEMREYDDGQWNSSYHYQMSLFNKREPIIDVGCSTGTFLNYWANHGGRLGIGIEPSNSAKEFAKNRYNVNVVDENSLSNLIGRVGMNIRMSLVLEHIAEPLEFIKKYASFMTPKTNRLMVIVPNEFNPLQKRIAKRIDNNWFISGVHINYFTPKTLRLLFLRAGLDVVHQSTTFPMEIAQTLGYEYIGNDVKGRKLHSARMKFENLFGHRSFELYKFLFDRFGWGREIIMVGEKV